VFVDEDQRSWMLGDSFVARDGSRWRIVSVDVVPAQLGAEGFEAAWIVEPLD
jgi:hypothetical protein